MRLKELEKEESIECIEKKNHHHQRWFFGGLLRKVKYSTYIDANVAFSSKWYADVIFEDKRSRRFSEIFLQPEAREMIMRYI
jgi:hypothetical protein